MIAPMTIEAPTDVTRAFGFELVCCDGIAVSITTRSGNSYRLRKRRSITIGVDYEAAATQVQCGLR